MGIGGTENTPDVLRAAILCAQLPPSSRIARAENPDAAWGVEAQFLRLVEYDIRCVLYALSKKGATKPEPIPMPSERVDIELDEESIAQAQSEIDEILGFSGGDD